VLRESVGATLTVMAGSLSAYQLSSRVELGQARFALRDGLSWAVGLDGLEVVWPGQGLVGVVVVVGLEEVVGGNHG
jgi:hypothetical protein